VSDYAQVIASPEAMTRLVVLIRDMVEAKAPTPLISATVPAGGRMVVCGDTHAQLQDVMWVFFKNGVPSPTNIYVFNGDICDRGSHAVEIFLILFLFKLNCYNSVHIIRGNHEDDYCNIYYGFLAELKHKFGPLPGGLMHGEFLRLFYSLPLACVLDSWQGLYRCNVTGAVIDLSFADATNGSPKSSGQTGVEVVLRRKDATTGHRAHVRGDQLIFEKRVATRAMNPDGANMLTWGSASDTWEYISPRLLVLHGGVPVPPAGSSSHAVLLKHFKDFPHRMKIPPAPKSVLEQWMYQTLWSDPAEVDGPKGRGTPFFAHHTKAFADANNLAAVIRAHQVPANQRGVSFHHKQKLVTIFTASNYCGTSQNYGGVAVFTPALFPQLMLNKTLFEHWAPPLSVVRETLVKHQNATQDVRLFIAHEVEAERAPTERASAGQLTHLEQKVGEYVTSLIVHSKAELWAAFAAKPHKKEGRFVVHINDWIDVLNSVIGHHFPWLTILDQLEIDLVGKDGIDFVAFLHRFKAGVRLGEPVMDTWEAAVVRGFFHELFLKDGKLQDLLLDELKLGSSIAAARLREILITGTGLSGAQATLFCQVLQETSETGSIEIARVFQSLSEYVRAYFSLIDAAPDSIPSDVVVQVGRDSIEFFSSLRQAIVAKHGNGRGDPIINFFTSVLAKDARVVSLREACARLENALGGLGLAKFSSVAANCMHFMAAEDNELSADPEDTGTISALRFYAACYVDGTIWGQALRTRVAEHATAAVYFHRNALRCACVHLDKARCGQIDRHSFQRALLALSASLEPHWKIAKLQLRSVIEYLRWSERELDDSDQMVRSDEERDQLLVIDYDAFLDAFEICDCQRMSRACSFGWHLVKDSFGADFSLD
jgi:protein phosphatase